MKESMLIEALKCMYEINNGNIKRISDCSNRPFTSHEKCGAELCQMKIKHMKTRDIAYAIQYGKLPKGRVVYKDGNRRNLDKDNLYTVSESQYMIAVSIALKALLQAKTDRKEYKNPKELTKRLALAGLESLGVENVYAEIKESSLGMVQKDRASKYIERLLCT